MARIAFIFIIACTIAGALFYALKHDVEPEECELLRAQNFDTGYGTVVFTSRDIKEMEYFAPSNLETRRLPYGEIPQDAITHPEVLLERRPGFALPKGHAISRFDIVPIDRIKWTRFDERREMALQAFVRGKGNKGEGVVIYPISDVPEGIPFESMLLEPRIVEPGKIPEGAVTSLKKIVGQLPKHGISQGQIICESDIAPR